MRLTYIIKYRLKLFRKYTIVSLLMFFINIYNNSSKQFECEKSSATVSVLLYSKNHFLKVMGSNTFSSPSINKRN